MPPRPDRHQQDCKCFLCRLDRRAHHFLKYSTQSKHSEDELREFLAEMPRRSA